MNFISKLKMLKPKNPVKLTMSFSVLYLLCFSYYNKAIIASEETFTKRLIYIVIFMTYLPLVYFLLHKCKKTISVHYLCPDG